MSDHLIAEANRHARALTIERDQIRTELALLREWQREVIQNANAHGAERKEAIARAERAEAELANIRALANRRNKRDHSADTTHQLVAALDQALDIAQAELATERARLDWLELRGPWDSWNGFGEIGITLRENIRAAIDAAMKEGSA